MDEDVKNMIQSIDAFDLILKESFGDLVRSLREKRDWTRKQLSEKALVSYKTIVDIEGGEKANLDRKTVTLLSNGLQLQNLVRRNFFVIAGLTPEIEPGLRLWSNELQDFYKGMRYPALVVNNLMCVHSFNSYLMTLFQLDFMKLETLLLDDVGPNILRVVFDPVFNARELFGNEWMAYAQLQVLIFRYLSQSHHKDAQYNRLVSLLNQLPDFTTLWDIADHMQIPTPPYFISVTNNQYGKVTYMHSEAIFTGPYAEQTKAAFYIPASTEDEKVFGQIRETTPNLAFEFMTTEQGISRIL